MKLLTRSGAVALFFGVVAVPVAQTANEPVPSNAPPSLKTVSVPEPPNLYDFVADKAAAIQLGKALFWDMQVGSDGKTACATCHFHAGADSRSINQINPGLLNRNAAGAEDPDKTFSTAPNYHLTPEMFPLRQLSDPTNRASTAVRDTNDVVSSQGVFQREFVESVAGYAEETSQSVPDDTFYVGSLNVRRVEPRHTPSVINAVFNFRNFWDGRAQNEFNGVNQWGDRDPDAHLYVSSKTGLTSTKVRLINSSLASQAVAPIVSDFEMSAAGRSPADIGNKFGKLKGKKLSRAEPLAFQVVHRNDSVLGKIGKSPRPGTNSGNYDKLIQKAFRKEWWQSRDVIRINADGSETLVRSPKRDLQDNEYTLIEYNFSLFFGLALQLYQATLVSDDAPYDQWREGRATISPEAFRGLKIFLEANDNVPHTGRPAGARCINCHAGPEFTDASVTSISNPDPILGTVRRQRNGQDLDRGYNNIGVRKTMEDLGVGGMDPFANPLSATSRCRLGQATRFCPPASPVLPAAVDGAFKAPGLRNVELTAPYFHNGSYLTLESVMDFYARGGDFQPLLAADGTTAISPLGVPRLSPAEQADLVAFLKTLTDERVRYRRAPFDHPQLFVPNGQTGNHVSVTPDLDRPGQAEDNMFEIPAVGRNGGPPLKGFLEY